MKRFTMLGLVLILTISALLAQKSFKKTYGGKNYDRGISVLQTIDGGFIVTGYTRSYGAGKEDVYLVHTDAVGSVRWSKAYGGKESDFGWAVMQTTDKGFIVTGYTNSFGNGGYDVYLVKTDAAGKMLWQKTFGNKLDDRSWDLDKTVDGGFIIVGETEPRKTGERDALLIKTDANGNVQWQKTYGGPGDDRCFSIRQAADGGFIFCGITYSFGAGDRDAYVVKTDAQGIVKWSKTFGGEKSDVAHSVRLTSDGGYFVTGYTASFSTALNDVYLIKLADSGQVIWKKTFGGADDFHTLYGEETRDGGYIISGGIISSSGRGMSACLIKTDSKGNHLWTRKFTETVFKPFTSTRGYNGGQTSDGGYLLAGDVFVYKSEKSLVYLVKLDKNGY
jgi:hypothetical protein